MKMKKTASMHMAQDIQWQTVKGMKRKKHRTSKDCIKQGIPLDNRYHVLTDSRNDDANTGTAELKVAKPPPIFVYGVTSLPEMQKRLNEFLDEEQHTTKSMANDAIKLTCQSTDTYRVSRGECARLPDLGRMFLKSNYTDITKNTYIRS